MKIRRKFHVGQLVRFVDRHRRLARAGDGLSFCSDSLIFDTWLPGEVGMIVSVNPQLQNEVYKVLVHELLGSFHEDFLCPVSMENE